MLQFLKSKKFNVFIVVICVLLSGAVVAMSTQNSVSPINQVVGTVFSPLQSFSSAVAEKMNWFKDSFAHAGSYKQEIDRLNEQIAEYESSLVDYDELQNKVKSYETMLEIKEENKDFVFIRSQIIGTDSSNLFSSLIIDKGSNDDVSVNDAVINGKYVVGVVKKVYPTYSVIATLLNPSVNISAIDSKSREQAYVTTSIEFSQKGNCVMQGLEKTTAISPGSIILTSGIGGIYPKGLIIGTVTRIDESKYDLSSYAVIDTGVDVTDIEDVYVLTDFEGQGIQESIE